MALLKGIVILQSLILFFSIASLGLDLFFINTYNNNLNVVFLRRFYIQMGLTGIFIFFFVTNLILLWVRHRRRRYEPTSPPSPSYVDSTGDRLSLSQMIGSVVRTLATIGLAVGMLYVTVKALINENRSIMVLPNPRNSPEYQFLNEDFRRYDPMNLLHCPDYHESDSIGSLCPLDKFLSILATISAVLVILEAPLMFAYHPRSPATSGKRGHSEHIDLERLKS